MPVTDVKNNSSIAMAHKRILPGEYGPVGSVSIVIDKSDYELSVYDEKAGMQLTPWFLATAVFLTKNYRATRIHPKAVSASSPNGYMKNGAAS